MGYDGYFAAHRAKTWTDLLFVPYSLRSRGCYAVAVDDVRTAVAPDTPSSGRSNAPLMD